MLSTTSLPFLKTTPCTFFLVSSLNSNVLFNMANQVDATLLYFLVVMKHTEMGKHDWKAVASDMAISNANNAEVYPEA